MAIITYSDKKMHRTFVLTRRRAVGTGWAKGPSSPPHILAEQLTLFKPGGRLCTTHYYSPPPCVEMGFTWTFTRNQDATVKLKSELISIKF